MNLNQINEAIRNDSGLSENEKQFLEKAETQEDIKKFLAGGAGATLGVVVAKYLKLSKPVQVVLGVLGYGAGKAVYKAIFDPNAPVQYNSRKGTYEIDRNRY